MLHVVRHLRELNPEQRQILIVNFLVPSTAGTETSHPSSIVVMVTQHINVLAIFMDQTKLRLL